MWGLGLRNYTANRIFGDEFYVLEWIILSCVELYDICVACN